MHAAQASAAPRQACTRRASTISPSSCWHQQGDWTRFAALPTPFQHAPANFTSLANVAVDVSATLLAEMVKVPKLDPGVRISIPDDALPNPQPRANRLSRMRHVVFHTAVVRPSHRYGGKVGVVDVVHDRGGSLGPR
ncbi:hypothetical protein MCOR27_000750 [Pyricularia oryzae]|uniref:Uncharacterized protein n=1 Tax=Pyricularia grisea TaxID=148305 RepID=A0ABQ8NC66_PYRGI|nr:hypothetical protein MCOR01_001806 [Pyricularia oryzae]KAI6294697.1 hypothetical protein MCOR33_008263 [Pyricularia grisea]KAH9429623.1 hypothetical protein MCOR02_009360 [Pyricularia oryzae]KAI6259778.1 hypothetical protein MCOR19_003918 [Pyricularia oryzae]KAI6278000.1 hypothetical protein MCOR26_004873 [Pyricularia oryzae]